MSLLRAANADSLTDSLPEHQKPASNSNSESIATFPQSLERRSEPRYPACEIVEVQVIGASGGRFPGTMLDISRSGLKIEVGKPLSQGAYLEILLPSRAIIIGEARYCRSKNKLYHVGVRIEGVYFTQAVSTRHVSKELLAGYKSLRPLAAMEVGNHLAACETCRSLLAEMTREPPIS